MMRFFIGTLALLLMALPCAGSTVAFGEPFVDTAQLPDASTTVLLHFDGNLVDVGGADWADDVNSFDGYSSTSKFGLSKYKDLVFTTTQYSFTSTNATGAVSLYTNDFTVEYWAAIDINSYSAGSSLNNVLFSLVFSNNVLTVQQAFTVLISFAGGGTTYYLSARYTDSFTNNYSGSLGAGYGSGLVWHHFAFERRSGTLYIYINGTQVATGALPTDLTPAAIDYALAYTVGKASLDATFYLDELRVKNDGYVYGGAFVPEDRAFGPVIYQKLITAPDGKLIFED